MKALFSARNFDAALLRLFVVVALFVVLAATGARADDIGRVLPAWEMQAETPASVTQSRHVRGRAVRANYAPSGDLVSEARRFLGSGRMAGMPSRWCKAFVNKVIEASGYSIPDKSLRAIDATRLGSRVINPMPGDLAVMRSHVTFFTGWNGNKILGLGGNQSGGKVSVSQYFPSKVVAFIRVRR